MALCVDVRGDGKTLASGGLDIQLWDVENRQRVALARRALQIIINSHGV
jgi:WD40 repeat protein